MILLDYESNHSFAVRLLCLAGALLVGGTVFLIVQLPEAGLAIKAVTVVCGTCLGLWFFGITFGFVAKFPWQGLVLFGVAQFVVLAVLVAAMFTEGSSPPSFPLFGLGSATLLFLGAASIRRGLSHRNRSNAF
ncbi:hypothetical protein [Abyssibacter profundi]|uniref:Uncharacterized protein n=1 Tax=Abyssibacter profundi TaxID=2182787 RepID=A0A383XPR0_9GAMM|nr:hypothetical protein [Abyssibacter profundi]PWN54614.1 hypothetical protein DEH80_16455 [Abyssibacter profundi]